MNDNVTDKIVLHMPETDEIRQLMGEFSSAYRNHVQSIMRQMENVVIGIDMTFDDRIVLKFHGMDKMMELIDKMLSYQQHIHDNFERMEELRASAEAKLNQPRNSSVEENDNV